MIGLTVSHYRIDALLGEGGMGVVYRAEDLRLHRPVALKFLPAHLVADGRAKDRFLLEAEAASALDHPNVCVIHEIDETDGGELFIAMGYYGGETLAQKLQRGPLPIPEATDVTRQVALGLAKAHARGIVHRDIKPANLKLTEDGIWKILDFGIAKLTGATRLTGTGRALGTMAYMSPEQAASDDVSPQSDIWSLGVVLYEMLAGALPFQGATPVATLYQLLQAEPKPIREFRDDVPSNLERVVRRALAKDVAVRYQRMEELLADLGMEPGVAVELAADAVVQREDARRSLTAAPPPFLTPEGAAADGKALPPFVGREAELAVLDGWLREALGGRGRVGFIAGDAGTGKTALAREFARRAAALDDTLIVATGNCDAHTGVGNPLHPFSEILEQLTGDVEAQWAAGSVSAEHATRLWSFLPTGVKALQESGPDLVGTLLPGASLLSRVNVHPSLDGRRRNAVREIVERGVSGVQQVDLMDQFVRVLRSLARERPFVLMLDDLQWADSGTIGLLFQLGRRLVGSRVLLIGLYRPSDLALGRDGQRHPLEPVLHEISGASGAVTVELGASRTLQFVDALVDAEPNRLGPAFRKALFNRTEGHALFTVELLRSMQERGALTRNSQGEWQESAGLNWDLLPARVDAVIAERMDRLPAHLRQLLTIASVEGAEFTLEAAARVQGVPVEDLIAPVTLELERRHRLVETEGLRRVNGQRLSVFRFRHILFQHHLYAGLTALERAHSHAQVGKALETLYGEHVGQIAHVLARHFQEAGVTERAFAYLMMAGVRARVTGAFAEAVDYFEPALEALLRGPAGEERGRQEIEVQLELVYARMMAARPGHGEAASRAHELAKLVGSKEDLFWSLHSMYWALAHYAPDNRLGRRLAEEALALARGEQNGRLIVHSLEISGRNACLRGDHSRALACYEELASLYKPAEHREERFASVMDLGPATAGMIGVILWFLGYPDQALARCQEAVAHTRAMTNSSSRLLMELYLAWVLMFRGNHEGAEQLLELIRAEADQLGVGAYYAPMVNIYAGSCAAVQRKAAAGIESMQRGLDAWKAIGWKVWVSYCTALLAQALRLEGRAAEGMAALKRAHASVEGCEEFTFEPEIHRTFGELHLGLSEPDTAAAEAEFRQAIDIARGQEAKSLELRATTSLARMLRSHARVDEARQMLRDIYGWFTEGFDTADLKNAKALLEELA